MNYGPARSLQAHHSVQQSHAPSSHRQRHASAPATHLNSHSRQSHQSPARQPSTECTSLEFTSRRQGKQPLYRPAALRRNNTQETQQLSNEQLLAQFSFENRTPPRSPSIAQVEGQSSWLGAFSGWASPSLESAKTTTGFFDGSDVRGVMCARADWTPDDQALICFDAECTIRFGLLERRHHCRQCGHVFCATHSSRNTLLWPSPADMVESPTVSPVLAYATPPTPKQTPKSTPKSSSTNLNSMTSSRRRTQSASEESSVQFCQTTVLPMSVRVCDSCFFSVPSAQVVSPAMGSIHAGASSFSLASTSSSVSNGTAAPLTFRQSSRHRSAHASPAGSPPSGTTSPNTMSRRASRSRQNSAHTATTSSSLDSHRSGSTPPTSVDGQSRDSLRCTDYRGKRGISPATSLRKTLAGGVGETVDEEDSASDTEEEEDEQDALDELPEDDQLRKTNTTIYGSVGGWATF